MKANKYKHNVSGFTLIEIIIVMVIVAMLAAVVGPELFGNLDTGRRSATQSQIASFEAALDSYRLDLGSYPDSLEGLINNDSGRDAWSGPYLSRAEQVPEDPWDNEYHYEPSGRDYELISYGADGISGGDEEDADIGH